MNKQISSATTVSMGLMLVVSVFVTSSTGFGAADEGLSDYFRAQDSSGLSSNNNNNKQLPVILMHKQALQEDGGFQYAFAADNGLRQGESIRPDGSRTGAYSYTDPDGKEISVKYTAGKDGFRIVQGDHVPKAPVSLAGPAALPAAQSAAPGRSGASGKNRLFSVPGGPGSQFSRGTDLSNIAKFYPNSAESYGSPSPYKSKFSKPQQHYRVREDVSVETPRFDDDVSSPFDGTGDYSSHSPFRAPSSPAHGPFNGAISDNSQRDDDSFGSNEQQPHTFGSGYAFEFGGLNNEGLSTEF